jgi:hypothetical protein
MEEQYSRLYDPIIAELCSIPYGSFVQYQSFLDKILQDPTNKPIAEDLEGIKNDLLLQKMLQSFQAKPEVIAPEVDNEKKLSHLCNILGLQDGALEGYSRAEAIGSYKNRFQHAITESVMDQYSAPIINSRNRGANLMQAL